MINHEKNYVVASNLRNSLAEILVYLQNEELNFHNDDIRLRIKLAFIDMFNVKDAMEKNQWSLYNKANPSGKELFKEFNSNFRKDIEGIRNSFSGHFDPALLHEVAEENPVYFQDGVDPRVQQIGIFIQMLAKCINSRKGKLNELFGGNCFLMTFKENQEKLRQYIIGMVKKSIKICDYVIEQSSPFVKLPKMGTVWVNLLNETLESSLENAS
ncbi:hypothetical protein ACX03_22195 [Vibrio parahaemolyticus]|nr:hypothetical protein ACX03_22195 [Vibrio parahaemolyticus]